MVARIEQPGAGYCRRGVAALATDMPLVDALDLIERACALSGAAYREALCQAVESATNTTPPRHARALRTLFLEIERILARLWYLGECARACDLSFYQGHALDQREALYAALQKATGTRHFWHVALPAGARDDLTFDDLGPALKSLESSLDGWRRATDPHGPLGRAGERAGVIAEKVVSALNLTSLAAAGSRAAPDLRQTLAYGGYADLRDEIAWPESPASLKGDSAERMRAAVSDLAISYGIALSCVSILEGDSRDYQTRLAGPVANTRGEARVEGPHGPITVQVTLGPDSEIAALTGDSSARATVDALPIILEDTRLDKVPLVLASLDLCLECNDQ